MSACREINIDVFDGRTDMHDRANLIFALGERRGKGMGSDQGDERGIFCVPDVRRWTADFLSCIGYGRLRIPRPRI